jgi:hypothetical protein
MALSPAVAAAAASATVGSPGAIYQGLACSAARTICNLLHRKTSPSLFAGVRLLRSLSAVQLVAPPCSMKSSSRALSVTPPVCSTSPEAWSIAHLVIVNSSPWHCFPRLTRPQRCCLVGLAAMNLASSAAALLLPGQEPYRCGARRLTSVDRPGGWPDQSRRSCLLPCRRRSPCP